MYGVILIVVMCWVFNQACKWLCRRCSIL